MDVAVAMRRLEEYLRAIKDGFSGLPQPHAATHRVAGEDPLATPATPTTTTVNVSADAGDGPSYALEDHQHAIDLGLTTKGDLLSRSSSAYARLAVGTAGQALIVDAAETSGMKWGTPASAEDAEMLGWLSMMGW